MSYLLPLGGFNRGRVETFPKAHPIREGAKQRNSFHFWRLIELVRAHPQPPARPRFARAREANDEAPASEHAAGLPRVHLDGASLGVNMSIHWSYGWGSDSAAGLGRSYTFA